MNWNQLQEQIESMSEEQRNMPVILVNEYDEIEEIDDAVWWNVYGHNHTVEGPTSNLKPNQPYFTIM